MFVKPAPGLKVRDPYMQDHLPPEGREVSDTDLYWERARIVGDIVVEQPATEPPRKSRTAQPIDRSTEQ